jgi:signal transduction histidine kinase
MRRRIRLVVAATTSAVILSFVIPLCALVLQMAQDRAVAAGLQANRNATILVATLQDPGDLADALEQLQTSPNQHTDVQLPGGQLFGPTSATMTTDRYLAQARASGSAFAHPQPGQHDAGAVLYVPVVTEKGTAVVRTTVTQEAMRVGVYGAWFVIVLVGMVLLLVALAIAQRLGNRISTPVTNVADVAHRLRAGELEARAELDGPPEVVELGHALNQLADRIGELLVAEREVAADLSHRLRTPVTALRLDAETVDDPETADRLREHIDHLQRTIDAVVAEARRPVRDSFRGRCDARVVVMDRVHFWKPLAEDQGRPVQVDATDESLPVAVAADDLRDLVDNLIDNVFAHTPDGTPWGIALSRTAEVVVLTVHDSGPGLDDPAMTARGSSGSGSSGLGLDIVRRIARSAGGELTVGSSPTGGASFQVTLAAPPRPTGAPAETRRSRREAAAR